MLNKERIKAQLDGGKPIDVPKQVGIHIISECQGGILVDIPLEGQGCVLDNDADIVILEEQ